jgi:hypothetical protein
MRVTPRIQIITFGGIQEMSFEGEVFYKGKPLNILEAVKEIRGCFKIGLDSAIAAYRMAETLNEVEPCA